MGISEEAASILITFGIGIFGVAAWRSWCGTYFVQCFGGGLTGYILAIIPAASSLLAGLIVAILFTPGTTIQDFFDIFKETEVDPDKDHEPEGQDFE